MFIITAHYNSTVASISHEKSLKFFLKSWVRVESIFEQAKLEQLLFEQ